MRFAILISLSLWLLGACAGRPTVSENQCAAGDWQTLGYRDAVNGYRSSRLLEHQDACVEYGIVPDRAAYMFGWDDGVQEYCEPNNAFSVGERGWQHNNVCPAGLREGFLHAYQEGRSLYLARYELANLEQHLEQNIADLAQVKSHIVSALAAQLDSGLTASERIELATRVQRLYEEKQRLSAEIPRLENELAIKFRALDRLNQSLAAVTH